VLQKRENMKIDNISKSWNFGINNNKNLKYVSRNFMPQNSQIAVNDVFIKNSQSLPSAQNSISFKAINFDEVAKLTKLISRKTNSKKRVIEKYARHPEACGITMGGGLPEVWTSRIKNMSNFDKEQFLERLGELFTIDRHFADVDVLGAGIEKLFKSQGIAQETDKVKTKYIEKGFFGRGFEITINDKDPILIKEFQRTKRFYNNHGNYS
jgi:hypothetical protein